ncbi:MAG: hypothetical protein A2V65_12660 [Deltaproteobacteria bacterium RBG_13_49_15]|nr:MAG: hypothetical protein A2V65_12660 [Deltaproteobacteria bacterium RBG_13_49_15]
MRAVSPIVVPRVNKARRPFEVTDAGTDRRLSDNKNYQIRMIITRLIIPYIWIVKNNISAKPPILLSRCPTQTNPGADSTGMDIAIRDDICFHWEFVSKSAACRFLLRHPCV